MAKKKYPSGEARIYSESKNDSFFFEIKDRERSISRRASPDAYTFAIYLWLGNVTNCGCFGATITVSPLSTVVKNVVLIILIKRIY
jgi:hypothetical protein